MLSLSSGWDSTAILGSLVYLSAPQSTCCDWSNEVYQPHRVINQFEIDRAKAVADYYGVRLDICDLSYSTTGPELLDKVKPLFRSQQFSSFAGINQWVIADFVAQTANGDEVLFNGEISDGAHNLGFSQLVTIFHPSSQDFREYSDKMASYLFGPTFLQQLLAGKHGQDPVWQLFRQRAGNVLFDELSTDPVQCAKQLLSSFFLRSCRLPLYSIANTKLLTDNDRSAYAKEMEDTYLNEAAAAVTPKPCMPGICICTIHFWQGNCDFSRSYCISPWIALCYAVQ